MKKNEFLAIFLILISVSIAAIAYLSLNLDFEVYPSKILQYIINRNKLIKASIMDNLDKQIESKAKGRELVLHEKPFSSPYVNRHLLFKGNQTRKTSPGVRHQILWWNPPGWMGRLHSYCNVSKCEYSNCVMTRNRAHFNKSSAVIFLTLWGLSHVPVNRSNRNPDQAWVFYALEPPTKFWFRVPERPEWLNTFNWSMTYRTDADISTPYGWLGDRTTIPVRDYSKIFHRKTKQVAWVVGKCRTPSKRDEFVKILQKYIQVDVYGNCGTKLNDTALKKALQGYKFYLGFENSLCKDYVTEKFFKYFELDLVVVVRGMAEYRKFLPDHTFINTADFSSIQLLGKHLNKLGNNETEYIKYLQTKDRYTVKHEGDMYCDGLCKICEKVNNLEDNRKTYDNIFHWTDRSDCKPPKDIQ